MSEVQAPFFLYPPRIWQVPFVFSSPHSGTAYLPELLARTALSLNDLRRSEDAFVDELYQAIPQLGAPLLCAALPRVLLDVNRALDDIDPALIPEAQHPKPSWRSHKGIGLIPTRTAIGKQIYHCPYPFALANKLIESYYTPYHKTLRSLIKQALKIFGYCILIDCHSMPSVGGPVDEDAGQSRPHIVLGDNHGQTASADLIKALRQAFASKGYGVAYNQPYAGGFITCHYGKLPDVQVVQIELCRSLYMDENKIKKNSLFNKLMIDIASIFGTIFASYKR